MPSTTITAAAASTTLNLTAASSSTAAEDQDIYDEIEIEDMTYDSNLQIYHYPCPCGDRFEIAIADLRDGQDVASYDQGDFRRGGLAGGGGAGTTAGGEELRIRQP
ncbi:Diphthamide biosynthesis protein 3 [Exophiala xenobiotica]|nr:Diphthamide biosynthesis protein 3 [Exophiala xenobiotica]